nr:E3 ubiquitin-protein ligase RNF144A isoform X4 [Manis javanica]XP_036882325.1 E3 ubiquitin-protein ligase RNF144A isoform X4 [Manis javanica]XP_036882326.1 E3 ubiquitin-protein ligase RNF144A isoform X4 [Manis javanica]XP_036882327.1 E3 ubiquitin-protein ligase RNF144A isoform X4 [Manis javanica]
MTTARYRPTWDLALDPLVSCKLCLGEYPLEQMTTITQCQCIFCTLCLKQYVELLIKEGLETAISCPDAACPKQGHLQENEIECMVAAEIMQRYKKLQFEREVLLDPCRTWCPASTCQAVCQLQEMGLQTPQLVQCKACDLEFCSACRASWHPGQGCTETMPITFLPGETSSAFKLEEDDAPIKRCPKCKVYIERDEGCAQMMCKNCKHAFCWYCLESLDDDFLLIHYDKGPCRNKLGHSRASVIWHRTQMRTVRRAVEGDMDREWQRWTGLLPESPVRTCNSHSRQASGCQARGKLGNICNTSACLPASQLPLPVCWESARTVPGFCGDPGVPHSRLFIINPHVQISFHPSLYFITNLYFSCLELLFQESCGADPVTQPCSVL